jgi:hypothetical protein
VLGRLPALGEVRHLHVHTELRLEETRIAPHPPRTGRIAFSGRVRIAQRNDLSAVLVGEALVADVGTGPEGAACGVAERQLLKAAVATAAMAQAIRRWRSIIVISWKRSDRTR